MSESLIGSRLDPVGVEDIAGHLIASGKARLAREWQTVMQLVIDRRGVTPDEFARFVNAALGRIYADDELEGAQRADLGGALRTACFISADGSSSPMAVAEAQVKLSHLEAPQAQEAEA